MSKYVGVIGSGSFGVTLSKLLAHNTDVLLYARKPEIVTKINQTHRHFNVDLASNIRATNSMEEVCGNCNLILPVVPSSNFRSMIKEFSPFLKPYHIMIHGTKGLDTSLLTEESITNAMFSRREVFTMSEVIRQESSVVRVGCLAGPNLAKEILAEKPAASVVASEFDEVINRGQECLSSKYFFVFGSHDIKGAELAGAYKNIIAIGSGILGGLNLGKNMQSLLITRGLGEMITFGMALGTTSKAFLGTAGIGDLIATATSEKSRNYTFGMRLAGGEKLKDILKTSEEIIEGVRTLKIVHHLAKNERLRLPITQMLYSVVFEDYPVGKAIDYLMRYPFAPDVDFI